MNSCFGIRTLGWSLFKEDTKQIIAEVGGKKRKCKKFLKILNPLRNTVG